MSARHYRLPGDRRINADTPGRDLRSPEVRRYDALGRTEPHRDPDAPEDFEARVAAAREAGLELDQSELTLAYVMYFAGRYDGRLSYLKGLAKQRQQGGAA